MDRLVREVGENTRLRAGIWMITLLILTWVSLVWSDFNLARYKSIKNLEMERSQLAEIESIEVWRARAEDSRARLVQLEQQIWQADTDGLAMARLQADLGNLISKDTFTRRVIKVGTPQILEEVGISRLRARVRLSATPEQLFY